MKTQKKEVEAEKIVEKKAKVEAVRRVEEALQQQKEQAIRHEANRKMAIIKELIEADSPVMRHAIEELSKGMFSKGYDATKTIEENLNNAMFVGGLMNSIQKIDPSVFLA